MLFLFFETNDVLLSEEQLVYDATSFLGEFGGHLGLFLGGSIPSMLYIIPKIFQHVWNVRARVKTTRFGLGFGRSSRSHEHMFGESTH